MDKFHYFLYGNKFTIVTDQKPLVSIYQKHLVDVSLRIQRLIVRTLPYNFHIVYVPGKLIPMAGALSKNLKKLTSEDKEEDQISLPILAVNYITRNYQHYPDKPVIDQIREETSKDAPLQLLTKYIRNGWPTDLKKLPKELHPYWNYEDELSLEDKILLKSYRILILYTLQIEMLAFIHEGHQGIEKCLPCSRESLFWPGISNEIHQTVDKCGICQPTSTAQRKLPSVSSEIPLHAWHTLGTDLFYWKHFDFLVLGDYFSKFLIVRKLPSSTSSAVCKEISIFTEFGKPYIIRSHNGPCYASKEFKELMELFQVHVTTSPYFLQSNGFAEAMVKIVKKLMDHSTLQEKPWNVGLMEYRCTPLSGNIPSPLELLTGQKPRTGFPSIPQGNSTTREYHEALIKKQQMDISEELSISTYEPGWFGVLIHLTKYGSQL